MRENTICWASPVFRVRDRTPEFTATLNRLGARASTSLPMAMFNQRALMISAPFFMDLMLMRASELYFDHVQRSFRVLRFILLLA